MRKSNTRNENLIIWGPNGSGGNFDTSNNGVAIVFYNLNGEPLSSKYHFTIRQGTNIATGKFSRPFPANIKNQSNLSENSFPIFWYDGVYGHSAPQSQLDALNRLDQIHSENVANSIILYASSNHVMPVDTSIKDYLDKANTLGLSINLDLGYKVALRHANWFNYSSPEAAMNHRLTEYREHKALNWIYIEDEPGNLFSYIAINGDTIRVEGSVSNIKNYSQQFVNIINGDGRKINRTLVDNLPNWKNYGYDNYIRSVDIPMYDAYPYTFRGDPTIGSNVQNNFSIQGQNSELLLKINLKNVLNNINEKFKPYVSIIQAEDNIIFSGQQTITDLPDYTEYEYRYMIYSALIHGARGLGFYSRFTATQNQINNINSTLRTLLDYNFEEIFMNKPIRGVSTTIENVYPIVTENGHNTNNWNNYVEGHIGWETYQRDRSKPDRNGIISTTEPIDYISYALRMYDDGYYLFIVNETNQYWGYPDKNENKGKVKILLPFNPEFTYRLNFANSTFSQIVNTGDSLTTSMKPYEVKVYKLNGSHPQIQNYTPRYVFEKNDVMLEKVKKYNIKAYPNPFNPSTTIVFDVPTQSRITINVFNSIGQKVATLVNKEYQVGSYSVPFDASRLSSGVYFYQLQSNTGVLLTEKMLLVK